MALEIENKYLIRQNGEEYVTKDLLQLSSSVDSLKREVLSKGELIRQGYLPLNIAVKLAVKLRMNLGFRPEEGRLRDKSGIFYLTFKGKGGLKRSESESLITSEFFNENWKFTEGKRIEKTRLTKPYKGLILELDVYTDRDLFVAEIEARTPDDVEKIKELEPIGLDITTNMKYKNYNLSK